MSVPEKIRRGEIAPWVGQGAPGCHSSASVCLDELGAMANDDPRRAEIEAQREAWLDRAAVLEELGQ